LTSIPSPPDIVFSFSTARPTTAGSLSIFASPKIATLAFNIPAMPHLQLTIDLRSFLPLPGIFRAHLRAFLVFLRTFLRIFSPHPPLAGQISPQNPCKSAKSAVIFHFFHTFFTFFHTFLHPPQADSLFSDF
jgi:hypothetical protein